MNYQKIYLAIIARGQYRELREYYEVHHILPKCMGGSDNINNLVKLTPEEHYLAHRLLAKIYPDNYGINYAAIMMCTNRPSNKLYGWLRRRLSKLQSLKMKNGGSPTLDKRWIANEQHTRLVEKTEAESLINDGLYISGKIAKRASCGHLVKTRCITCENLKRKSYDTKKTNAKEMARMLYDEFIKSNHISVTQFASENRTSQPRLSILWKKYIPEYVENRKQGKTFKS